MKKYYVEVNIGATVGMEVEAESQETEQIGVEYWSDEEDEHRVDGINSYRMI